MCFEDTSFIPEIKVDINKIYDLFEFLHVKIKNGHLRGPVTLAPIAKHLAVELSLCFYDFRSVAAEI